MPGPIYSNVRAIAQRHGYRARQVQMQIDAATVEVRDLAQKISVKHMNRLIYSQAIPRKKSGKPKWKRTRRLRNAEKAVIERVAAGGPRVVLKNTMRYAEPRHEMGKPGRRFTKRKAHWRD